MDYGIAPAEMPVGPPPGAMSTTAAPAAAGTMPSGAMLDGDASGGAGWSGWESLGGILTSGPAVTSWAPGRLDVFVRGTDNALWHKWFSNGWSGWESLGGVLTSDPAAVSWGPNRIDVFVRGTDNALWHKWFSNGWSGWESLGGGLTSGPAVASWGSNRLDVFVRGTDNALWHKWWANGWSGWESLGGVLMSDPEAVSWYGRRIDVFVRGTDNALWHKWFAGAWSNWESLGGVLTSGTAAASWAPNRLDVFVRGTDNAMWHKWFSNGWSGWESLGGILTSDPAAVSWQTGRIDAFVRGTDNATWHKWWSDPAERLVFTMQHQQQTNWCWAANGASVAAYYGDTWTQCAVANGELGRNDCCSPTGASGACNVYGFLDQALSVVGHFDHMTGGTATRSVVTTEIDAGRPVGARTAWSGGGAHFVQLIGVLPGDLYAVDDPIFGKSDVSRSVFTTTYQGSGSWTHTYFTR
jgi:hypothetical protein